MKEVKSTQAVEKVTTTYVCEHPGCDFSTTSRYEADRHEGQTHSFTKRLFVQGVELLFFAAENGARLWEESGDSNDTLSWKGPGWYAVEEDEDGNVTLPIADFLQVQVDKAEWITQQVQELRKVTSETPEKA